MNNHINASYLFVEGSDGNRNRALISFAGRATKYGGIPQFEFKRTLNRLFPQWDKHFLVDLDSAWYQHGLRGLSHDIPSTVSLLTQYLHGYNHTVMMGISAGGYAAILFGSLLEVDKVIAFQPQTTISREKYGRGYNDLRSYINNNTHYLIFGNTSIMDPRNLHHISHCHNIAAPNVEIRERSRLALHELRDSGELDQILLQAIAE